MHGAPWLACAVCGCVLVADFLSAVSGVMSLAFIDVLCFVWNRVWRSAGACACSWPFRWVDVVDGFGATLIASCQVRLACLRPCPLVMP